MKQKKGNQTFIIERLKQPGISFHNLGSKDSSTRHILFSHGRLRLETLLHSFQVLKLIGILTQAPSHDTTKLLLRDDFLELAGNQLGGIPCPEEAVLAVEVVLTTALVVGLAILLGLTP